MDLDGHGYHNAFAKGCPFLLDLFAAHNLQGAITWFYNCGEKELSEHPFLLREIKKRHDEVAALSSGKSPGLHRRSRDKS